MTYHTKKHAGKRKGGKSFFGFAKNNLLNSTKSVKKQQRSVFYDIYSAKTSTKIIAGIVLATVLVILVGSMTKSQISVSQKQKRLDELDAEIAQQELDNAELEQLINGDLNAYIEDYARDKLDMVKPGERVYINTVGE